MSKVNIADLFKDVVPDSGTESIQYISLDLIDEDERNFYEVSGIEDLADNISAFGLLDPLRIREAEGGRYVLVSGHRRRKALLLLREQGDERFEKAACIVEAQNDNTALQELRLIMANKDTRKMTQQDLARQIERTEALIVELEEHGYEFPGRRRDWIAQICSVNNTKVGNVQAIKKHCIPEILHAYEQGDIVEATALTLSGYDENEQRMIFNTYKDGSGRLRYFYDYTAENAHKNIEAMHALKCPKGCEGCHHIAPKLEKIRSSYQRCQERCCGKCPELGHCQKACPEFADKIKKLKADAKAQKQHEEEVRRQQEQPLIDDIERLWYRFGQARRAAGLKISEATDAAKIWYNEKEVEKRERLCEKTTISTQLPFGYGIDLQDIRRIRKLAEIFGCTVDYLLCRTDDPNPAQAVLEDAGPRWNTGKPPKAGRYFARFMTNPAICQVSYFNGWSWQFKNGTTIEAECTGWWPLPEED